MSTSLAQASRQMSELHNTVVRNRRDGMVRESKCKAPHPTQHGVFCNRPRTHGGPCEGALLLPTVRREGELPDGDFKYFYWRKPEDAQKSKCAPKQGLPVADCALVDFGRRARVYLTKRMSGAYYSGVVEGGSVRWVRQVTTEDAPPLLSCSSKEARALYNALASAFGAQNGQ